MKITMTSLETNAVAFTSEGSTRTELFCNTIKLFTLIFGEDCLDELFEGLSELSKGEDFYERSDFSTPESNFSLKFTEEVKS